MHSQALSLHVTCDALEGEFSLQGKAKGEIIAIGKAIFKSNFIDIDGEKINIDTWQKSNGMISAFTKESREVFQAQILEEGKVLKTSVEGVEMTFTREN